MCIAVNVDKMYENILQNGENKIHDRIMFVCDFDAFQIHLKKSPTREEMKKFKAFKCFICVVN